MKFGHILLSAIFALNIFSIQAANIHSGNPEEDIQFTRLSIQDGLSESVVLASCQDGAGHMWFATQDGLNRYNGYGFTVYRNEPEDSTTIADNVARIIFRDSKDRMWFGTAEGLSLYDFEKDVFRNYPTEDNGVTGIAELEEGQKLAVASGGRLRVFDIQTRKWEDGMVAPLKESFGAYRLIRHENTILVGTMKQGLFCYDIQEKELTKVSAVKCSSPIQSMFVENGRLWMGTEGEGLFRMDIGSKETVNYRYNSPEDRKITSNYVRALSTDIYGRMWVGTFNGLCIIDEGKITSMVSSPEGGSMLSQSSVRCISRDTQGGMWLGTWYGGINYWHPQRNRFRSIRHSRHGNSINDDVVSCITEDSDGNLWIGTKNGGVNFHDKKTGRYTYFQTTSGMLSESMESNDIKDIHIHEDGNIYVGAHAGGISIIDRAGRKMIHCQGQNEAAPLDVYSIKSAGRDRLWVGTLSGLKSFNIKTGVFTDVSRDCLGTAIPITNIMTILKHSDGYLWLGGADGACCLKDEDGILTVDMLLPAFKGRSVQHIFEASTKVVWLATRNGLVSIDRKEGITAIYTRKEGLPSNIIHGIEEDESGRLWISTESGISCLNPFTGRFRNFTSNEGITNTPLNPKSHCRRKNGEMLFGGIYGITAFSPANIEDNPFTPSPQIERLQVLSKTVRPDDGSGILKSNIMITDKIRLRHNRNSFTLEFSVVNHLAGRHNTFAYKLEGLEKEWTETDMRSVSYSNLSQGNYRFMLKAANNDGKWNEHPTILDIEVMPVWYRTTFASISMILLILLGITGGYRYIINRKEKENKSKLEKQEKAHQNDIHQMKMRFFINISHEMRTPLTLIINPLQEMIAKSNDTWMQKQLKYVERNAKRLLHLVNQLMDYRRAELGVFKLKIRPENVHKIIKENWAYYEKLAIKKKIRYSLISNVEGRIIHIDGQYLELILNNLLSNAFKYTETGEITISASEQDGNLSISVSDTGRGIAEGEQEKIFERFYQTDSQHIGSGIGLSLVQRLVELHHGQIKLQSEPGQGSIFTVTLPLSLSAYSPEEIGSSEPTEAHSINSPDMYIIESEKQEDESGEISEKKRGKILIAEDNDEVRTYMKNGLSKIFDIKLAKNGEEALQMLKEDLPDLVVTDMMMPVMDGKKLCMNIKQNISTSHIPVIMLSAKTDSKDEFDALKSGADDFMPKPFSMSVLVTKIQNMLRTLHHIQDKATNSMEISPEKISFNTMDEEFLTKAISTVESHMDDTTFSTTEFAKAMNMSRSNLHLKLKALTGESALDFIRKIRFKEACRLLKDGRYSISEISDRVGFNTPSYFATCFKKYMGCLPTEYIRKHQRE